MADKRKFAKAQPTVEQKIDLLYQWLNKSLDATRDSIIREVKYSSMQMGAVSQEMKAEKDKSSQALAQEIRYSYKQNQTIYDGLASMLTKEVGERLNSLDEKTGAIASDVATVATEQGSIKEAVQKASEDIVAKIVAVEDNLSALDPVDEEKIAELVKEKVAELVSGIENSVGEIKYTYLQQQAIYDGLTELIRLEVLQKLEEMGAKLDLIEEINERVAHCVSLIEEADFHTVIESVAEKTEESISEHSRQVLDAVASIPVAENVDYTRIVDEVGDRVLELLGEIGLNESAPAPVVTEVVHSEPVEVKVDYDKIVYGTAEKVVESLPYPEKVDYRRINDNFQKAVQNVKVCVEEDVIANAINNAVEKAVEKIMASIDVDAIATAVAEKMVVPTPEVPEIDYDLLAEKVAEKLVMPEAEAIDYDVLSEMVSTKIAQSTDQVFDVVLDEAGIDQIADKVSEKLGKIEHIDYDKVSEAVAKNANDPVDYERIAGIVEEKLAKEEDPTYELVVDDEGVQAIAKSVAEELCQACASCECAKEEPVAEEPVVQPAEETVEAVAEEVVEAPAVEEPVAEEPVAEETPVAEELAVSAEPVFNEETNELVDAETGLVIRLKRSFTAKMKQSEERVKEYYSSIKNELTSYKRINSNVSWHGDRFNYGRDTIAKVNICGKTLCFYLALDPEDPEYKPTVYHQKNVGNQKAYESTPFMFKVKSDAAVKKALRLVGYLAEKVGAVKDEKFETVDYTSEFAFETTKQLYDQGYIKATKEKKVDLSSI